MPLTERQAPRAPVCDGGLATESGTAPFLDCETAREIQWHAVWDRFAPVTPYGKRWKETAQPFRAGEEEAWAQALQRLASDVRLVTGDEVRRLRGRLERVPDVRDILAPLSHPDTALSPRQCLQLKQFLVAGRELAADAAVLRLGWTTSGLWDRLLASFGGDLSASFALDHVGGPTYQRAAEAVAMASGALARAVRARDEELLRMVGRRPDANGRIVCPLPADKAVADQLEQCPLVRWLQNTPFESVFEALPSAEMQAASEQLAASRAHLDDVSAQVLKNLSDELRARLPDWRAAVTALEDLDVRLAKVQFYWDIDGCIPAVGPGLAVDGAVHPAVAQRLKQEGRRFAPLGLALGAGVHLICGSNMGGKTVAMATLCVCQALAQFAMPVPAERFETTLLQVVRFCGTAATDMANGLSSFGAEVARLTEVWADVQGAQRALVCFDEPGKSTNPVEGEALTVGLIRALQTGPPDGWYVLVATHFSAPLQESGITRFKVRGLQPEVLQVQDGAVDLSDRLRALEGAMSYAIEPWDAGEVPQEALRVAEWLGAPAAVLDETRAYLRRRKPQ
jgi:DNA mismatch repair protein MutS2